ncbi:MAG TPA: hypothetical protein DEQ26_13080 [Flavobacteriaceae bacterium]|nr:hypothetical protein [Flavobacteriaceae bacterium]
MAERVNGIIKMEFNLYESTLGFDQTKIKITNSIKTYNELRPHASCDYLIPNAVHLQSEKLKKGWKNYNRSFNNQNSLV